MPGALPLLLVAVLTPAGTWHVGAPDSSARPQALVAIGHCAAEGTGQATERSIVVRGPDSREAMPASEPERGSAAKPEELRPTKVVTAGRPAATPGDTARARGPPGASAA